MEKPNYKVVKSRSRAYGYAIQSSMLQDHVLGSGNTFGWYKLKSAAKDRCNELNECEGK